MERQSNLDRPDFDIQPEAAARWIVDHAFSGRPEDVAKVRQTLCHLARQPSPFVPSQSLLEQHVDSLAHALLGARSPDPSSRQLLRGTSLLLAAGNKARRSLVVPLLVQAIHNRHERIMELLIRRIPNEDTLLAARRVVTLLLPEVPLMPALFPLGERLIQQLIVNQACRQDDVRAVDRLLAWGGEDLYASLSSATLQGLATLEGKLSKPTECLAPWVRRQALAGRLRPPRS